MPIYNVTGAPPADGKENRVTAYLRKPAMTTLQPRDANAAPGGDIFLLQSFYSAAAAGVAELKSSASGASVDQSSRVSLLPLQKPSQQDVQEYINGLALLEIKPGDELHVLVEGDFSGFDVAKLSDRLLPTNVFVHVRSLSLDDGFSAFVKGEFLKSINKGGCGFQDGSLLVKHGKSKDKTGKTIADRLNIGKTWNAFVEGLKITWAYHKLRIILPTVLLGLFLFFPISTASGSLLPGVTVWLLANVSTVLMIGGFSFLAGYLIYQWSQTFSDKYDSNDDFKDNSKMQKLQAGLNLLGQSLMWAAVGFGLFSALFTPAVSTFIQEAVIGNGVTGLVSQLLASGMYTILGVALLAYAVGVILTKFVLPYSVQKIRNSDPLWKRAFMGYLPMKLGRALVYSSIFVGVFILAANLSLGIVAAAGGSNYLGLAIALLVTAGPVLGKLVGRLGQLTGWAAHYSEVAANGAAVVPTLYAVRLAAWVLTQYQFATQSLYRFKMDFNISSEAKDQKQIFESAYLTNYNRLLEGPQSKPGKLLLDVYAILKNGVSTILRGLSFLLGEVNAGFELLEGKSPDPLIVQNNRYIYIDATERTGQTLDNYDPILQAGNARHDRPDEVGKQRPDSALFCPESGRAVAYAVVQHVKANNQPFANSFRIAEQDTADLPTVGSVC